MPPLLYLYNKIRFHLNKKPRVNLNKLKYVPRERVVCSANKLKDGTLILGVRHGDFLMINTLRDSRLGDEGFHEAEQGFINQRGEFLTRKQAWIVAFNANQIIRRVGGDEGILYSENLF